MNIKQLLALATASAFCACSLTSPATAAPDSYEPDPVLTAPAQLTGDRFALDMFRELAATQSGNITFSPASLEAVLQLLRGVAAGGTRAEFDALRMGQTGIASAMQVQSADALFAAEDLKLKPAVAQLPLHRTDFKEADEAAEEINDWCAEQTKGLIPSLVTEDDFSEDTRLVILNAIYLKEKWLRPFDGDSTQENGRFRKADGSTVSTPLMRQTADFRYAEGADWQAVALFYRRDGRAGEPACFIGILPKGDARAFAKGLTVQKYDQIRLALAASRPQEVALTLPKMDVDSGAVSLKPALFALGLQTAFSDAADFSGLAEEELKIDKVLQRCHVIVSEKETEAAAVTAAIMMPCYIPMERPQPKVISFDRPFIWAIGDLTTGAAPFFLGLCEEP